ncbi:hypothetical protein llap_4029 [Limosa lapponica baueri]|uniref:Uncharacterized protein n=1 Tax=Limosa lapponica baueri TaxID=1758121 RepID=A0A2I0UI07_LIMLA|nr:hypothetical protein llap_4029 [Limosa lapponica baueri]
MEVVNDLCLSGVKEDYLQQLSMPCKQLSPTASVGFHEYRRKTIRKLKCLNEKRLISLGYFLGGIAARYEIAFMQQKPGKTSLFKERYDSLTMASGSGAALLHSSVVNYFVNNRLPGFANY